MRLRAGFFVSPSVAAAAARETRVRLGFASTGTTASAAVSVLRVRRRLGSAAGSAIGLAVPSSSPAASLRAVRRRRAGLVRFVSSAGAERLGGGGSTAGGVALRVTMAREGSGGAVTPVEWVSPFGPTSKMCRSGTAPGR